MTPEEEIENRAVKANTEFADLMALARLKYLNREPQSGLLDTQVARIESRLGVKTGSRSSGSGEGQPTQQVNKDGSS